MKIVGEELMFLDRARLDGRLTEEKILAWESVFPDGAESDAIPTEKWVELLKKDSQIIGVMSIIFGVHANLRGANLRGANLRDADLVRANLRDTDLVRANLRDADLRGADLRDADLRDANLRGADLRDADLEGADLRDADLEGADLRGANLRDANLVRANLRDAALEGADLRDANLVRANLRDADLEGADLRDANLRDANLRGADLGFSVMNYTNTKGTGVRSFFCEFASFTTPVFVQVGCKKLPMEDLAGMDEEKIAAIEIDGVLSEVQVAWWKRYGGIIKELAAESVAEGWAKGEEG